MPGGLRRQGGGIGVVGGINGEKGGVYAEVSKDKAE